MRHAPNETSTQAKLPCQREPGWGRRGDRTPPIIAGAATRPPIPRHRYATTCEGAQSFAKELNACRLRFGEAADCSTATPETYVDRGRLGKSATLTVRLSLWRLSLFDGRWLDTKFDRRRSTSRRRSFRFRVGVDNYMRLLGWKLSHQAHRVARVTMAMPHRSATLGAVCMRPPSTCFHNRNLLRLGAPEPATAVPRLPKSLSDRRSCLPSHQAKSRRPSGRQASIGMRWQREAAGGHQPELVSFTSDALHCRPPLVARKLARRAKPEENRREEGPSQSQ